MMRLTKKQRFFYDCLRACGDLKKAAAESGYRMSQAKKYLENPRVAWYLERMGIEPGAKTGADGLTVALQGQKNIAGDTGEPTGVVGGGEEAGSSGTDGMNACGFEGLHDPLGGGKRKADASGADRGVAKSKKNASARRGVKAGGRGFVCADVLQPQKYSRGAKTHLKASGGEKLEASEAGANRMGSYGLAGEKARAGGGENSQGDRAGEKAVDKKGADEPGICSPQGTDAQAGGATREFLISEIQKFWYSVIFTDETADLKDKIKASELIAKTTGAFGEPKCEEEPKPIRIVFGGEEEAMSYGE